MGPCLFGLSHRRYVKRIDAVGGLLPSKLGMFGVGDRLRQGRVSLGNFGLGPRQGFALSAALPLLPGFDAHRMTTLDVDNNRLDDDALATLLFAIAPVGGVPTVCLARNTFGVRAAHALVAVLAGDNAKGKARDGARTRKGKCRVTTLLLAGCGVGKQHGLETWALLGEALQENGSLRRLDLSDNGFGAVGTRALGAALAAHPRLRELSVAYNGVRGGAAVALLAGVDKSVSLQSLDLSFCPIGSAAAANELRFANTDAAAARARQRAKVRAAVAAEEEAAAAARDAARAAHAAALAGIGLGGGGGGATPPPKASPKPKGSPKSSPKSPKSSPKPSIYKSGPSPLERAHRKRLSAAAVEDALRRPRTAQAVLTGSKLRVRTRKLANDAKGAYRKAAGAGARAPAPKKPTRAQLQAAFDARGKPPKSTSPAVAKLARMLRDGKASTRNGSGGLPLLHLNLSHAMCTAADSVALAKALNNNNKTLLGLHYGGNGGGAWVDAKGFLRYDGDRRTSGERSPNAGKPGSPHAFARHAVLPTTGPCLSFITHTLAERCRRSFDPILPPSFDAIAHFFLPLPFLLLSSSFPQGWTARAAGCAGGGAWRPSASACAPKRRRARRSRPRRRPPGRKRRTTRPPRSARGRRRRPTARSSGAT